MNLYKVTKKWYIKADNTMDAIEKTKILSHYEIECRFIKIEEQLCPSTNLNAQGANNKKK